MTELRIQKFLSEAGVASRRAAEEMVRQGRVAVNGKTVTDLPVLIDPDADRVSVDGRKVTRPEGRPVYFLLNKPRGVVSTSHDPRGRPTAVDLVPEVPGRKVHCVGRLDADSTGLLILTDDGDLTQYLTHPRHEVPKTYVVEINGRLTPEQVDAFKHGVRLDGKKTGGARLKVLDSHHDRSVIEVTLREGRNREIRRVLARLGLKVRRLKRTAIGSVTDRGLKVGNVRTLKPTEVSRLRHAGTEPLRRGKGQKRRGGRKGKRS